MSEPFNRSRGFEITLTELIESLESAVTRIESLRESEESSAIEAQLFNLGCAGWAVLELARAWAFEARLGIPKKETDALDILAASGWIEIDRARRLKQVAAYREIPKAPHARRNVGLAGQGLTEDLGLLRSWIQSNREWLAKRPD